MNDAEYIYKQDVREKAITARSSHKYGSSRRRKPRMSTDSMTRKEWEKMNGPVSTVQLNEPITWEVFCELPKNLQQEYVKHILAHYSVGPYALARMFGVSGAYCGTYMHALGITFTGRASQKETARFLADYGETAKKNETVPCADKKKHSARSYLVDVLWFFLARADRCKAQGPIPGRAAGHHHGRGICCKVNSEISSKTAGRQRSLLLAQSLAI